MPGAEVRQLRRTVGPPHRIHRGLQPFRRHPRVRRPLKVQTAMLGKVEEPGLEQGGAQTGRADLA